MACLRLLFRLLSCGIPEDCRSRSSYCTQQQLSCTPSVNAALSLSCESSALLLLGRLSARAASCRRRICSTILCNCTCAHCRIPVPALPQLAYSAAIRRAACTCLTLQHAVIVIKTTARALARAIARDPQWSTPVQRSTKGVRMNYMLHHI